MVEAAASRELPVLAGRGVELRLHRVADLAQQAVGALDLAREHELDEHGLERDAVRQHRGDERVVDRGERRREHLLDPEVEHRLLSGSELDRALAQTADRLRDCERAGERVPGDVAVHTDRGDEARAFLVATTHLGPEHARRDHADVAVGREAIEGEGVPARDDRARVGARAQRERRYDVVGNEDADHVGIARVSQLGRREPLGLGQLARRVLAHADERVESGVAQVQRPRSALVAVADDGDPRTLDRAKVAVRFAVRHCPSPGRRECCTICRNAPSRRCGPGRRRAVSNSSPRH